MNTSNHLEEEANYSPISQPLPIQTEAAAIQERVTAQEFAQALASLEAQRERSERALHNTVPIGEALQELGLTASAAEILAEVQALRRRQAQEQQAALQQTQIQHKRRYLGLALTSTLVLCLSFFLFTSLRQLPSPEIAAPASIVMPQPAPALAELQTLAEAPEGQMVYCKPEDFKALLQNPDLSPSQVIVQTHDASASMGKWTLVKHDGHTYVRGYMAAMSPQAMAQMKTLQMFSGGYDSSQAGGMAYVKPVTVRLGSFAWKGTGDEVGIPYIRVSNLHLDPYANAHP